MKALLTAIALTALVGCSSEPKPALNPDFDVVEVDTPNFFSICKERHLNEGIPVVMAGTLNPDDPLLDCIFWGATMKTMCEDKEATIEWMNMYNKLRDEGVENPAHDSDVANARLKAKCKASQGALSMTEGSEEVWVGEAEILGVPYISHLYAIPAQLFHNQAEDNPKTYWTSYGVYYEVAPVF